MQLYQRSKAKNNILRPTIENVTLLMGKLMFELYLDYENELYSMWKRRKLLLENLQEVN